MVGAAPEDPYAIREQASRHLGARLAQELMDQVWDVVDARARGEGSKYGIDPILTIRSAVQFIEDKLSRANRPGRYEPTDT